MACFTALDYRNKSYPLLQTIQAQSASKDAMSDAAKMYQFYNALTLYGGGTPIAENCFVQKTEDQQLFLLNNALALAL
jgi:cyanate lyase